MKISVASEKNQVSNHFGHCEGFTIYEVKESEVLNKKVVENPGHRPGFLPRFLKDLEIDVIIAGGMGETAQQLFKEQDIEVVVGASGLCDDLIKQYLRNELKSTGSVCTEHQHEGNCGN
ncbi:dinitrogenase iron-molybdenum cofactor [Romboutsia maritimum]|uniref:Dinitrogenase iron-molybdenum cofactor n=1 Tax=Romboutsia maritimum TaxID=2020948 RepID=A0A255IAG1_9FIRM|nr:NifB/NifX family molybdenum-iron cluster-binding protein [Romboutsia maritimum]RDY24094.1 dinitrogenase iron-molybdenum cofactor [Romboutsia maritimum]